MNPLRIHKLTYSTHKETEIRPDIVNKLVLHQITFKFDIISEGVPAGLELNIQVSVSK